jgi:hypothetical protein
MASSHKATVIARQMAEDIRLRSGLAAVVGVDSSANTTITVGTGAAGSQSAYIRIILENGWNMVNPIWPDFTSLQQRVYTPHITQVVLESSTVAGVPLMTLSNLSKLLMDITKSGTKVELYLSANTTAVSATSIAAGNKVATLDDLFNPLLSTM